MPQVQVPGVGTVSFPDEMSASDIQHVIETELLPKQPSGPAQDISTEGLGAKALRGARALTSEIGTAGEAISEGAMRTVEGTGELVSALAQAPFSAYDAMRSPKLSELVTGKQPSSTILKDYQDAVASRRADAKASYEKTYGQEYPEILAKASELGIGFSTGATESKAVDTVWKAIKAGAKAGAVVSAMTYTGDKEVSDKLQSTLVGGALGGIIGTVPGMVGAGRNIIRRYLTADPVAEATKSAARVQQAFPSLEGELTISQNTGNVKTQQLESTVASRRAQEQWIRQQAGLVKDLKDLATKYGPDMPAEEVVKRGGQAIANASRKLSLTRKAIWNSDLDAIRTKLGADAGTDGGKALVEMPGLQDRVKTILDGFGVKADNLSPAVRKILETHSANNGAIPFDDLDYLLRQLNEKNFSVLTGTGNARAEAVAAKQLRKAVSESLDETADSSEVGALLKQARETYAQHSGALKELNTSAAARALGVDKNGYAQLVQNPEAAMDQILTLTPSQQRQAMGILKTSDPELVASLRGINIRSALKDATEVTAAGTPSLNVQKFVKTATGGGELRGAGLYTPADADVLKGNIEALNALIGRAGYKAQVTPPTDVAMSTTSAVSGGTSVFLIRVIGRILGGFGAEKVLFDPKARKEFLTLKDSFGTKSAAASAAAGRLGAMLDATMSADDPQDAP
jgi:hypothetical protein